MVIGDAGTDLGLDILVDNPSEVGADRLVNAVAAHALHDGALILVDFGTATTFDVITENGDYGGGVIALGRLETGGQAGCCKGLKIIVICRPSSRVRVSTLASSVVAAVILSRICAPSSGRRSWR